MKLMKLFCFLILSLIIWGCSSGTLKVQTVPSEADIEIVSKNGARKNVGKSPISLIEIPELKSGELFIVKISKDPFETENILVPEGAKDRQIDLQINLKEQKRFSINPENQNKILNDIASSVADIQRLIQGKQYDLAKTKISTMMGLYPYVGIFYSFMGNIYYLERNIPQAIFYYGKALDIDPSAIETRNVLEKLQKLKGGGE